MAGNGREFTRSMIKGSELQEDTEFTAIADGVFLRGWSFEDLNELPLSYDDMQRNGKNVHPDAWGIDFKSTSDTSFRVVVEIPQASKTKTQTKKPPQEKK